MLLGLSHLPFMPLSLSLPLPMFGICKRFVLLWLISLFRARETWSHNNHTQAVIRSSCLIAVCFCYFGGAVLQHCFDCVRSLFLLVAWIESSVDVRRDRTYSSDCDTRVSNSISGVYLHCEGSDNKLIFVEVVVFNFKKREKKTMKKCFK